MTAGTLAWARAFARQAKADHDLWNQLRANTDVPSCQSLLLLQMACEKLCKARLAAGGTPITNLEGSHGYIARPLPEVLRDELIKTGQGKTWRKGLGSFAKQLSNEIELLNPSVDRNRQRIDNCEYPWEDLQNRIHSPLDHSFPAAQLLEQRQAISFLKVLKASVERAAKELGDD